MYQQRDSAHDQHMHHIVTPVFVDRPRWSDCTAGQMDGESGCWTTRGKIGLPLARVMGVGNEQQDDVSRVSGCYIGCIVVNDVIWRRLCVGMIREKVIGLFCDGQKCDE